ncbi:jg16285 [Pararge aegeria aegeria]|uniref:Jg16285 protein n=1 Tax=Pararge aegeria aegeria TaxID=348720 RepID=A0A8S4RTG2_9NEOP|nr:jg16285 [Pararge aegeria aegeria]
MPPPSNLPCGPYCGNGYCASHCYFRNMPLEPSHVQQWKSPPYSEPPSRNPSTSNRPPGPHGPRHRQPSPGFPHPPMQPPQHRSPYPRSSFHRTPANNEDPFPPVHRPL